MTAKLVVWDEDRPRALARLREALAQCGIEGPKSNIAFLERLVRHPVVVEASIDTGYPDRHLEDFIGAGGDAGPIAAAATVALLPDEAATREPTPRRGPPPHARTRKSGGEGQKGEKI